MYGWNGSLCSSFDQLSLETDYLEKLSVFPNPSRDLLHIEGLEDHLNFLSLIDIYGRSVIEQPIELEENGRVTLDVSTITRGLYTLQLRSSSGQMFNHKVYLIE
jgi:hypothetical protein